LREKELTRLRSHTIGFVFQFFNLLSTLTVEENVCLPALLQGRPLAPIKKKCGELLERVSMGHRSRHRLHQLSGGEMQRTALARALILEPKLVLADEPTGNLDSETSRKVMELFCQLTRAYQATLVLVTHSNEVAGYAARCIEMRDGIVVKQSEAGVV
jgi:putative ABC transport system ATP-binding protein